VEVEVARSDGDSLHNKYFDPLRNSSLLTFQQPTLIAPTPDRDVFYVYCTSHQHPQAFGIRNAHTPGHNTIRRHYGIVGNSWPNIEYTLEIGDSHKVNGPWTQKRAVDAEENRHPIRRQRNS
jgi:hypothetical protein